MSIPIRIKRSAVPGKRPAVDQLLSAELAYNTYDGELTAKRERPGIGTDIIRIGAGATVTNIIYVTKDGNDSNTGLKLGDAKATIAGAIAISTTGSVIRVSAGSYVENNPIAVPNQVSIVGDSLREVSVTPQNQGDLFYLGTGNYVSQISFVGSANTGAIFSFNPNKPVYNDQSPYVQNCTNFIPNSIGMKVDGKYSIGPTKSMVLDSYTQYNQGGIGVSITNEGYAQLVSLFTICPDTAVFCGSGGACDLTNSNASFGNYGLVSDGVGPKKYTGIISATSEQNSDTFVVNLNTPTYTVIDASYDKITGKLSIILDNISQLEVGMGVSISGLKFTNYEIPIDFIPPIPDIITIPDGTSGYVFEIISLNETNLNQISVNIGPSDTPLYYYNEGTVKINTVRPFDGQVVYFKDLYYTVGKVQVGSGGTGYNSSPVVTISPPSVEWGIQATAVAEVVNGSITNIEIVSSGRGYSSIPTVTIGGPDVGINTATATLNLLPTYYPIVSSTPISSGICTITVSENVPFTVGIGTSVPFFKQSRVLASGHSFEYIGSGTNINNALPNQGGIPIQDNEVDMRNGGLVVFTSTDQSGNFRIGDGVQINQTTGTISGIFYSKSLFSTMTPFILALGGE